MRRAAGLLLSLATAGLIAPACDIPPPIIDPFPISISLDAGVPLLGARSPALGTGEVLSVVLDTASAITVLDDGLGLARRRRLELDLLRYPLSPAIPRARFPGTSTLLDSVGAVGLGEPVPIAGVIGADMLSLLAVRLDPSQHQLTFFPSTAGSDGQHEEACQAVFKVTLAGSGSYVSGNDVVDFLPTRVVLGACLSQTTPDVEDAGGSDSLLLLSTGVGPTILSRTAYKAAAAVDDAAVDALPTALLYLPGDASMIGELAHVATLPRLAIVGNAHNRGPCRELTVSRIMATTNCAGRTECTCGNGKSCSAAAIELGATVNVAILEDTHPLLQSLRNELRPTFADIAGLLGMEAIGQLVTELDYPGSRVLFRCASGASDCVVRARAADEGRATVLREHSCLPPLTKTTR